MSWADRSRALRALTLLLCGGLAGCGFHPLYGGPQEQEVDASLASIRVLPIPERLGQQLANSLRDSFNPTSAKVPTRYNLTVGLYASRGDIAIRRDGTASREQYIVSANFRLIDAANGTGVMSGTASTNNSYDIGENEYSVIVANDDAQTRAAEDIAQQIRSQVALFLHREAAK